MLGFIPELQSLCAFEPVSDDRYRALHPKANNIQFKKCENYSSYNVCNWMVAEQDAGRLCVSCRLNKVIPNLSEPRHLELWYEIEKAKRRLVHTLLELGLPIVGKDSDKERGLAFQFLADAEESTEFFDSTEYPEKILTGHSGGIITINLLEADPSRREEMRAKMKEGYRTLLGHFRHEIAHYYWYHLVEPGQWLQPCRDLFGDERIPYDEALSTYYRDGPQTQWEQSFVSAYASAHPSEDWAETWAHYLHMIDTLGTAHDAEFVIQGRTFHAPIAGPNGINPGEAPGVAPFDVLLQDWVHLTLAMTRLNRSMGLPDPYPFVFSTRIEEKLAFIHRLVGENPGGG
jgi:hypothetical protein